MPTQQDNTIGAVGGFVASPDPVSGMLTASVPAGEKTLEGLWKSIFPEANPVENTAADMTAKLLQEQFADWEQTFKPIELQALNQVSLNNAAVLPGALDEAKAGVDSAYSSIPGMLERQNRSLGIEPTAQQNKSTQRMMNVNQSLATAGAENSARSNVRQLDEQILMGSTPNPNIAKAAQ